ncbi:tRNA 2-thiouridine(34) synthase MnmA [Candidatus Saccharibacteria bacterium CG_4_10_14_0_2_um_filter_52_9]|nr:MAG: tRNA 2-thiouridine(34) synthase MnmA [Candidatus Saccharibacteria bacterium CG_4_10_14_0_2_um_filter_52_9]
MANKVYVGMSGGVDSSVTAALLKEQGYEVTGVYMKNWSQDLPGFICPWKEDYQDAKRVAVQLGIDFKLYDFETEYRHKVVDYMVAEYQAGCTPNPDIMCNQEVKFKLFLETALADGADLIATGHYARIKDGQLLAGLDKTKDQSYFLYRVTEAALRKSLMPIGELHKTEVRRLAQKLGLSTADKPDSQGICFVGKVGIKEFLLNELGPQPHGPIIDQTGKTIGQHDGALFYTIGQRHGLDIGGGLPYYVASKDMKTNTIYVTTNLDDKTLWSKQLNLNDLHWISNKPDESKTYQARLRYRGPLVPATLKGKKLTLKEEQRGLAAGQSAVIYDGDRVLGGGIIS